jgi:predicted aspartyl protease
VALIHRPLVEGFALVPVRIGVTEARRRELAAMGAPMPADVLLDLLVDTGASQTVLDKTLILPLGLVSTDVKSFFAPAKNGAVAEVSNVYKVSFTLLGDQRAPLTAHALPVFENDFSAWPGDGLLGMDVLKLCQFVFNGPAGSFTLAW